MRIIEAYRCEPTAHVIKVGLLRLCSCLVVQFAVHLYGESSVKIIKTVCLSNIQFIFEQTTAHRFLREKHVIHAIINNLCESNYAFSTQLGCNKNKSTIISFAVFPKKQRKKEIHTHTRVPVKQIKLNFQFHSKDHNVELLPALAQSNFALVLLLHFCQPLHSLGCTCLFNYYNIFCPFTFMKLFVCCLYNVHCAVLLIEISYAQTYASC